MSEFKLIEGIVALSDSERWDEAKLEWKLADVYREDEPETCLCGHYPINEICILRNSENSNVGTRPAQEHVSLKSQDIYNPVLY